MGFGMSFHKCNITGELIDIRDSEYFFFSYYEGSILSLDVDHSGQQGILLNSSIVSILQKLDTGLLDDNSSFNISSSDTFTIHDFLSRYFSIHSHKNLHGGQCLLELPYNMDQDIILQIILTLFLVFLNGFLWLQSSQL